MSIRARLMLLVLSLLLPALGAVAWAVTAAYRQEHEDLSRHLREASRSVAMVVDRELTQRATIAKVLSASRGLDAGPAMTSEDRAIFELQARRAMEGLDGWVVLLSDKGEVINTLDAAGRPLDPPAGGAVATPLLGAATVLPMTRQDDPGGFHARVVEPVVRGGRTLFNVAVTVRAAEMQRLLDAQPVGPKWVAALIDGQGKIVARNLHPETFVGGRASSTFLAQSQGRQEGVVESITLEGTLVLTAFNRLPQGWTYALGVPRSELSAGLPLAAGRVTLAAVLGTMLAVWAALWVSRRITGPIDSLKQAAARLGRGEPVEPPRTGLHECDEVGAVLAEASQASREARATLAQQVAMAVERTREAEQRVSRSQRVEALGRLTGGVAHDFNNLLGVISNSAYLIERKSDNPALQTPVAAILRAVDVGSRLTQHLLRFSGRQPVSPQTLDPQQHLADVQDLLKAVVGSSVKVEVQVTPGTRPVTVDSSELELALINLALNARDAMPGGGKLQVRSRNTLPQEFPELPPGHFVLISVSDTGSGIDPALMTRVFEPFFTTKVVGKGTGLGLSQVHGFCTQAGGTAHVISQVGEGTTVSLVLPASDERVSQRPDRSEPEGGEVLRGRRVLMVEDNDALGDVTAALLEAFGCHVHRARSGDDALTMVLDDPSFDVVLSDVVMPGTLDGVALAKALRECRPLMPVVLISGNARSLEGAHGFEVLRKPCAPQDLVAALNKALKREA